MMAFNEKCDAILYYLKENERVSWARFTKEAALPKYDALLIYLKKNKEYIDYSDSWISITEKGNVFITTTSFVDQRKVVY